MWLEAARRHNLSLSAWNFKHEYSLLLNQGLDVQGFEWSDPMLIAYLLNERGRHDLESVALSRLGVAPWKEDWSDRIFAGDPTLKQEEIINYNAKDVVYEAVLHQQLTIELSRVSLWNLYKKLLIPATQMFVEMERRGIYVDKPKLLAHSIIAKGARRQSLGGVETMGTERKLRKSEAIVEITFYTRTLSGGLGLEVSGSGRPRALRLRGSFQC